MSHCLKRYAFVCTALNWLSSERASRLKLHSQSSLTFQTSKSFAAKVKHQRQIRVKNRVFSEPAYLKIKKGFLVLILSIIPTQQLYITLISKIMFTTILN